MIKSKSAGFSLIELMIVVAIIAILAAIAIPNFMKFSMKAKTSEATSNLNAIRVAQDSYRSENDAYLDCTAGPAAGGTDSTPDAWDDPAGFVTIGFAPDGNVRYQYDVDVTPGGAGVPPHFMASAVSDLDEDGLTCVFAIATADTEYPKVQKNPTVAPAAGPAWTAGDGDDY
jgi:type IV pilus assembly protein PilA